jgi:hypothetical protein
MLAVPTHLAHPVDAVRAVGDRRGQISEYLPGRVHPRTLVGVGQRGSDLR